MREIYNEGRVAGLSAWELYVRHLLSKNPTATPMTEQQWLSATLSSNTSMILRVPEGTSKGVHDFKLPADCDLCGCSTIYGSIFEGEVTLDETSTWAVRIDDYGKLIRNDWEASPVTPGEPENIPYKDNPTEIDGDFAEQCKEYYKISRALMFQPGEWTENVFYEVVTTESDQEVVTQDREELLAPLTDMISAKSLEPDMSQTGFIRLAITGELTRDVLILFHGFSYKALVESEVGYAYVPDLGFPRNGGFLGPATFPWGCEIVMLMTTDVMRAIIESGGGGGGEPIPEWVNEWNPEWKDIDDPDSGETGD